MPFEPKIFNQNNDNGRRDEPQAAARPDGARPDGAQLPEDPIWDDAEALELPDDLAMLAGQLRDDAVHLAQRHPADASLEQRELVWQQFVADEQKAAAGKPAGKTTEKVPAGHAGQWRWISAAAALAIVIAVGTWALNWVNSQGTSGNSIAVSDAPVEARPHARSHVHNQFTAPATTIMQASPIQAEAIELPADQPRLIPAAILRDVSAPELEGMLDLLEQDESGISI